jgi:endonuclease-3
VAVLCTPGLAEIKTGRVQSILQTLVEEGHVNGDQPSLDYLWDLTTAKAKAEIVRFNGVGPKTAACVLMFAMRRCARNPPGWAVRW